MQVLEPGQSAPVRLSNMIARPACVVRQNLDTRGHAPEKFDRITGRQGNDIRHSALIIKDKLARIAVRSQCARRLGRQPQ
jgi:hypothetical protein